jgi:mitochondrial fission protein ELM1
LSSARVWILLSSRAGANNQALALAEAVGLPFEAKRLTHNALRRIGHRLGRSRLTLGQRSRQMLAPPWPELVIAVSRGNVPVARWIKARSGGKSRTVFLGNPRVDPGHFDLVLTTVDHLNPRGHNVLVLPLPLAIPRAQADPPPGWCAGLPGPRLLLLMGGPIKHWLLTPADVEAAVASLAEKANALGGSLIVGGSPRTPDSLMQAARRSLAMAQHGCLAPSRRGGIDALLAFADQVFVTGDSMAMVTEAILAGKPTGIIPLTLSDAGQRRLGLEPVPEGSGRKGRDLRRFWNRLWSDGLAGTIDEPRMVDFEPTAHAAAMSVRKLLDHPRHLTHGRSQ